MCRTVLRIGEPAGSEATPQLVKGAVTKNLVHHFWQIITPKSVHNLPKIMHHRIAWFLVAPALQTCGRLLGQSWQSIWNYFKFYDLAAYFACSEML